MPYLSVSSIIDNFCDSRAGSGLLVFLALDALVDLLPMHGHVLGRVDSNPDLVALHAQYGHRDFVTNHHGLANSPGQYQHNRAPSFRGIAVTISTALDPASPSSIRSGFVPQEYKNPNANCCIF